MNDVAAETRGKWDLKEAGEGGRDPGAKLCSLGKEEDLLKGLSE